MKDSFAMEFHDLGNFSTGTNQSIESSIEEFKKSAGKQQQKNTGKKNKRHEVIRAIFRVIIIIFLLLTLTYMAYVSAERRTPMNLRNHKNEPVVRIDGDILTVKDMAFYIMYEERLVENEAEIYNKKSTKDFWNIHTNGYFMSAQAKKAALGMAVHDRIFYEQALKNNIVLTTDEKNELQNSQNDFWDDLYPSQKENMLADSEDIDRTMYEIALAEKYQMKLAEEKGLTYHSLDWNGYDYEQLEENEHEVKVNKSFWHSVMFGEITIRHDSVNFINGQDDSGASETDE